MRWEGNRLLYDKNGVTVVVGNVSDHFTWMLSDEAKGQPVWGMFIQILGSPDSKQSVNDILDNFYNSDYFKGTGCKPIKKEGF